MTPDISPPKDASSSPDGADTGETLSPGDTGVVRVIDTGAPSDVGPSDVPPVPDTLAPISDTAMPDAEAVDTSELPAPPKVFDAERSLVWIDPAVLTCGLACVMARISPDGHGGPLLKAWFERFATTAHSERLGPQQLLETYVEGPPELWDLDALPFVVTAIHNRIDLREEGHCGEVRLSVASTDPILKPFHIIFLFRQEDDGQDCKSVALTWGKFSELSDEAFQEKALELIDTHVTADKFLVAETLEFMVAPWEWRQWFFEPSDGPLEVTLENRPLFQTVDTLKLNQPGEARDAFLAWVAENAGALDARMQLIPEKFRALSVQVNQGVPWIPLSLDGLEPELLETYPTLRQNIEMVGCAGCHTADADFVQTLPDRTFSEFYKKELEARADYLESVWLGTSALAPFGPLQGSPVLTP